MPASSASACWTPPAPGKCSPRRRPTRWSPRSRRSISGAGVVLIVKNYEGDVMNFEMAAEMRGRPLSHGHHQRRRRRRNIDLVDRPTRRRGHARRREDRRRSRGAGRWRARDCALGRQVNRRTRSMGVALTSCTVPAAGKPNFDLGPEEMEMGVGIHGEPGRRRSQARSAACDRRGDGQGDTGRPRAQARAERCSCSSTGSAARR